MGIGGMEELYPDSFLCPTGGGMLEVMFWNTAGGPGKEPT